MQESEGERPVLGQGRDPNKRGRAQHCKQNTATGDERRKDRTKTSDEGGQGDGAGRWRGRKVVTARQEGSDGEAGGQRGDEGQEGDNNKGRNDAGLTAQTAKQGKLTSELAPSRTVCGFLNSYTVMVTGVLYLYWPHMVYGRIPYTGRCSALPLCLLGLKVHGFLKT